MTACPEVLSEAGAEVAFARKVSTLQRMCNVFWGENLIAENAMKARRLLLL